MKLATKRFATTFRLQPDYVEKNIVGLMYVSAEVLATYSMTNTSTSKRIKRSCQMREIEYIDASWKHKSDDGSP